MLAGDRGGSRVTSRVLAGDFAGDFADRTRISSQTISSFYFLVSSSVVCRNGNQRRGGLLPAVFSLELYVLNT